MAWDQTQLADAAARLREAREVVVFSGAGISAESGIATFRDEGGFWQEFPPEHFAHWAGLVRSAVLRPRKLARFVLAVLGPIAAAAPNAAHRAVAGLERHARVTVVTQNIDGLHGEAGSTVVREIHGSLFEVVTLRGRFLRLMPRREMRAIVESVRRAGQGRLALVRLLLAVRPLFGLGWRGPHRPGVVMFGQAMAEPAWRLAQVAADQCDLMIAVGTSGAVMPAAGLPMSARRGGATIVTIDPATPGLHDVWLAGPAGEVLPVLVAAAFGEPPGR